MSTTCEAGHVAGVTQFLRKWTPSSELTYTRCTSKATCLVRSGCVHEHVHTWQACAADADAAERQIRDGKSPRCVECKALPPADKHECAVVVRIERPTP